jgi:hypothetical protein
MDAFNGSALIVGLGAPHLLVARNALTTTTLYTDPIGGVFGHTLHGPDASAGVPSEIEWLVQRSQQTPFKIFLAYLSGDLEYDAASGSLSLHPAPNHFSSPSTPLRLEYVSQLMSGIRAQQICIFVDCVKTPGRVHMPRHDHIQGSFKPVFDRSATPSVIAPTPLGPSAFWMESTTPMSSVGEVLPFRTGAGEVVEVAIKTPVTTATVLFKVGAPGMESLQPFLQAAHASSGTSLNLIGESLQKLLSLQHFIAENEQSILETRSRTTPMNTPAKDVDVNAGGMLAQDRDESTTMRPILWIDGSADAHPSLKVNTSYFLQIKMSDQDEPSLVSDGEGEFKSQDIPEGGLATEWVLTSSNIKIIEGPGVNIQKHEINEHTLWTATFDLNIPKSGESRTRRVEIVPISPNNAMLTVLIYARYDLNSMYNRRELVRQFNVAFSIEV